MIGATAERAAKLFPHDSPMEIGPLDIQLAILETLRSIETYLKNPVVHVDERGNFTRLFP